MLKVLHKQNWMYSSRKKDAAEQTGQRKLLLLGYYSNAQAD